MPALNIPGVKAGQLRMTGLVLGAIFASKITHWNDREIQQLNLELRLPNLPIKCILRSNGSGSTTGFAEYLSKADPEWGNRIGTGL